MKIKALFIALITVFVSCSESYNPKPLGYHRIDLSEKEYQLFDSNCSYQFLSPKNADIIKGKRHCWYSINYPNHNATIYLTYKKLNSNLESIIEESHKLAYDHAIRSDGIIEQVYANEDEQVYGVLYDIHGNSASNLQFFLTDSTDHFLRGSLYFNETPNADSLLPVKEYIKEDFITLIESLTWS
ncbi:MAG: gliding motility lipoprotein GldD [Flavobacteriales bacterium]|nr:gliding motility lipoprotein GldD [Flavobacteriales bacterium]